MKLANYNNRGFERGRSAIVELLWIVVQALFISSFLPGSMHRRFLLRRFGAKIGKGVVIKNGVRVKFPWRLTVGDHSWIGERVWIDNLDQVVVGANCCISQEAYLCTGSHDWTEATFNLICKPITIDDHSWICARSNIAPGVVVGEGAVLAMGSTASNNLENWKVFRGNPAVAIRSRDFVDEPDAGERRHISGYGNSAG